VIKATFGVCYSIWRSFKVMSAVQHSSTESSVQCAQLSVNNSQSLTEVAAAPQV